MSTVKISSNNEIIIFPCHPADQISTDRSLRMRLPVVGDIIPLLSQRAVLANHVSGMERAALKIAADVLPPLCANRWQPGSCTFEYTSHHDSTRLNYKSIVVKRDEPITGVFSHDISFRRSLLIATVLVRANHQPVRSSSRFEFELSDSVWCHGATWLTIPVVG